MKGLIGCQLKGFRTKKAKGRNHKNNCRKKNVFGG